MNNFQDSCIRLNSEVKIVSHIKVIEYLFNRTSGFLRKWIFRSNHKMLERVVFQLHDPHTVAHIVLFAESFQLFYIGDITLNP